MVVIGITGGSGVGKTTVSDMLRKKRIEVIDADVIARRIVEKGKPALGELVRTFGEDILNEDGTLDRKRLGKIVFSDADKLEMLNTVTHKYIKEEIDRQLRKSRGRLVGIDGALLIESGLGNECDCIIAVLADKKLRISRIAERDRLSETDAQERIDSQKSDAFYKEHSDFVIYNNDSMSRVENRIDKIISAIRSGTEVKR